MHDQVISKTQNNVSVELTSRHNWLIPALPISRKVSLSIFQKDVIKTKMQ